MAVLNFPINPQIGDVYEKSGLKWEWNGYGWSGTKSVNKYVGDTPPPLAVLFNGFEWFDTTTGINYTWYVDVSGNGCFVGK